MLRLLSLTLLILLLCSCIGTQRTAQRDARLREIGEWMAQQDEREQLWQNTFEQLPGTPVSRLTQTWGKPKKIEKNVYHWDSRYTSQKGGYYETDGTTRQTIRDKDGYAVGSIETPRERYVEPYTVEVIPCAIQVTVGKNGIITHAAFKDSSASSTYQCVRDFPFPE